MSNMATSSPLVSLSCPVCSDVFSSSAGASFALHVSSCSCSSPPPSSSPSSSSHCPRCYHVYSPDVLPHEISFHERECGRVNPLLHVENNEEIDVNCPVSDHKIKRQRNDTTRTVGTTPPRRVSLFPSNCFLCGNRSRGLLHCNGTCARSAHQYCINQLQASMIGDPLSIMEKKQAAEQWKCAQCLRGIHSCRRCGFLGHEDNQMQKCTVSDCGYCFHPHCQSNTESDPKPTGSDYESDSQFICPRHTCLTCETQESDMKRCKSCSICFTMTHLRCPRGSGAAIPTNTSGFDEPMNFFECSRHEKEATMALTGSSDSNNSLRLRFATGDVVLVLEFNNALLPLSVKTTAPDAANHWGVVVSAEEMEPRGCGNQLLKVKMFADNNVLSVPNQYALRVTTASDFSRPVDLIRHCVQRHAMVELQLRQMEGKLIDDVEAKHILFVSTTAFTARLKHLGVTVAEAMSYAEEGLVRWRQLQNLTELRQYDGLGESAPIYLYIDTRGSRPGQEISSNLNTADVVADKVKDVDGDVSMTGADTDNGGAAINGSTLGSPHLRRPKSVGKSPHEAEIEQAGETDAILVDTRLTSAQDTSMTDTQDTQPENDSESWSQGSLDVARLQSTPSILACMNTPSSDAVGPDVNIDRLMVDVTKCTDIDSAKRQKLNTESRVHFDTPVFTPTKTIYKFLPGATLSSASAPATLHLSPMASSARTLFSQKREELTRKQKLLAEMPPLVMEELEREALRYLEEADGLKAEELKPKLARIPADVDAFPWAARATRFRPAFYRPTVMLGHSGLRRPGLDAVSRLLVSQDKRSIKCFVQTLETNAEVSRCTHLRKTTTSASPGFMLLDLLSLRSFRDLESVVRRRVVEALGKRSRYTREYFGMDAHQVRRWLEQQRRKKTCDQPPITLSYCAADGVRRHLYLHEASPKPSPKDMQAWLCFCANVCHVSVAIMIQSVARSTLTPITTAFQQVSAAQ